LIVIGIELWWTGLNILEIVEKKRKGTLLALEVQVIKIEVHFKCI